MIYKYAKVEEKDWHWKMVTEILGFEPVSVKTVRIFYTIDTKDVTLNAEQDAALDKFFKEEMDMEEVNF